LALDQWPTVTAHRRQPTAAEIDRRMRRRDEDHEVQQLYEAIMRQTDPALRP
jgi:hypothetical protein